LIVTRRPVLRPSRYNIDSGTPEEEVVTPQSGDYVPTNGRIEGCSRIDKEAVTSPHFKKA
jgi:hypothetical protein